MPHNAFIRLIHANQNILRFRVKLIAKNELSETFKIPMRAKTIRAFNGQNPARSINLVLSLRDFLPFVRLWNFTAMCSFAYGQRAKFFAWIAKFAIAVHSETFSELSSFIEAIKLPNAEFSFRSKTRAHWDKTFLRKNHQKLHGICYFIDLCEVAEICRRRKSFVNKYVKAFPFPAYHSNERLSRKNPWLTSSDTNWSKLQIWYYFHSRVGMTSLAPAHCSRFTPCANIEKSWKAFLREKGKTKTLFKLGISLQRQGLVIEREKLWVP